MAYLFLGYKLYTFDNYAQLLDQLGQMSLSQIWWLIAIVVLMPLNWVLEAYKWKRLTANVQKISIVSSTKAILAGISTGFFTPNRVGEFVGRVFFLDPENRKSGVTLSMVNSLTQNLIMALFGVPACFLYFEMKKHPLDNMLTNYLLGLDACILLFGIIYFSLPYISKKFANYNYTNRITQFTRCLTNYSSQQLIVIIAISFVRYLVFCIQFYFMLQFFGVEISILQAAVAIPTTYLFVTFTPSFAFSEVAVRSSYAVLVIGAFSGQVVSIALAGLCIWLINFVLPMLAGSIVVITKKV